MARLGRLDGKLAGEDSDDKISASSVARRPKTVTEASVSSQKRAVVTSGWGTWIRTRTNGVRVFKRTLISLIFYRFVASLSQSSEQSAGRTVHLTTIIAFRE
jgi:hypothetical protein